MRRTRIIALVLFWLAIYLPNLNHQLLDPFETLYVEAGREMNLFDRAFTPVVNGEPLKHKPPLFFWIESLFVGDTMSMERKARFPSVMSIILLGLLIYSMGIYLGEERLALYWSLLLTTNLFALFIGRSALPTALLMLIIFFTLYSMFRWHRERKASWLLLAIGSTVTSLYAGGIIAVLTIVLTWWVAYPLFVSDEGIRKIFPLKKGSIFIFGVIITIALASLVEYLVVGEIFIVNHIKGIRLPELNSTTLMTYVIFALIILSIGIFPLGVLSIGQLMRTGLVVKLTEKRRRWHWWMVALFIISLLMLPFHDIGISTFPLILIPLSYFSADFLDYLSRTRTKEKLPPIPTLLSFLYGIFMFIIGIILIVIPIIGMLLPELVPYIPYRFWQEALQSPVHWEIPLVFIGLTFITGNIVIIQSYKSNIFKWTLYTTILNGVIFFLVMDIYVPRFIHYWQGEIVEVYKSMPADKSQVQPINFTTHAHLLYLGNKGYPFNINLPAYKMIVYRSHDSIPDSIIQNFVPLYGYYYKIDTLPIYAE